MVGSSPIYDVGLEQSVASHCVVFRKLFWPMNNWSAVKLTFLIAKATEEAAKTSLWLGDSSVQCLTQMKRAYDVAAAAHGLARHHGNGINTPLQLSSYGAGVLSCCCCRCCSGFRPLSPSEQQQQLRALYCCIRPQQRRLTVLSNTG